MWVKKPSRVPGRIQTVRRLAMVSRTVMVSVVVTRPFGVFCSTAAASTMVSTPNAVTVR